MRIIVDTREQLPYEFLEEDDVTIATLATGDYSLVGCEDRITIERKRLSELWTITGRNRARFEREIQRMTKFEYAAIVVESSIEEVMKGHTLSTVPTTAVINSLISWSIRHDVHIWWAGDRLHGMAVTRSLLKRFEKYCCGTKPVGLRVLGALREQNRTIARLRANRKYR